MEFPGYFSGNIVRQGYPVASHLSFPEGMGPLLLLGSPGTSNNPTADQGPRAYLDVELQHHIRRVPLSAVSVAGSRAFHQPSFSDKLTARF